MEPGRREGLAPMQGALLRRARQLGAELSVAELKDRIDRSGQSGAAVWDLVLSAPTCEHYFKQSRSVGFTGVIGKRRRGQRCACLETVAADRLSWQAPWLHD